MQILNRKSHYVIKLSDATFVYRKTQTGQKMILDTLSLYREVFIKSNDEKAVGGIDGAMAFIEMEMAGTSTTIQ